MPHQCCLGQTLAIGRRSFFRPLAVGPRLLAERVFLRISVFPPPVSACVSPPRRHETDIASQAARKQGASAGHRSRRPRAKDEDRIVNYIFSIRSPICIRAYLWVSPLLCRPSTAKHILALQRTFNQQSIVINQQNQSNEHKHKYK